MHRRYNLDHLIFASVIVLGLTRLMVCVEAQIAFVSHRDGNPEIYVMDTDGQNQHRLTENRRNDLFPSWAPDGNSIVFFSNRDGHVREHIPNTSTYEIYVMDANGGNPQNITNNRNDDRDPAWSPDGQRIAFISDRDNFRDDDLVITYEIYVMNADGTNPQNITNDRNDDRGPAWSPDGKHIAFESTRNGHFKSEFIITSEIYVIDADGGNEQRLTENRKNEWGPVWSPDGKRIVFASDRKGDIVNLEIYVMDADGDDPQRITENRIHDTFPSWSPDGKRIAFVSDRDGNWEIYVMDADGNNQRNLTNHPDTDFSPAWFHSPFSVSPAGKQFTKWGQLKQSNR